MNVKGIAVLLLLAAASLSAEESPTVDLFAGWSWYPYPYAYPYPYYWGYGSGVRIKLKPGNPTRFPDPKDVLLPQFPGSAPTSLKDETQEKAWEPDIESFLAALPTAAERLSSTNVPTTR